MNKLTRISATVASSLALVAGFSGVAAASPSISDTGHNSHNKIVTKNTVTTNVENETHLGLKNSNPQWASSGDVNVRNNDDVDGVTSGNASNSSTFSASVSVDNSSATSSALSGPSSDDMPAADGSISDTGHNSTNKIVTTNTVTTNVENETGVWVDNSNCQNAQSGDVNVKNNDDVSNVTSGDATNTSNATFSVSVTN